MSDKQRIAYCIGKSLINSGLNMEDNAFNGHLDFMSGALLDKKTISVMPERGPFLIIKLKRNDN